MVHQGIFDPIANVLGVLMKFIYFNLAFENYGIAIVIFTIIMRLILLPLNIKQTKSMAAMQRIQPQLQEIQKKYKNDKERLNKATMELYSKHKVNPAGGCLPLVFQMPILFSLYYVIRQPLKFMFRFDGDMIKGIADYIVSVDEKYKTIFYNGDRFFEMNADLPIIKYFSNIGDGMQSALNQMQEKVGIILDSKYIIHMDFFGMNLGEIPTYKPDLIQANPSLYIPLLIIPVLAAGSTFLSSKYSQMSNTSSQSASSGTANNMTKNMMYFMPVMTLFFTFSLPAGLGLYWITGNLIQILQQTFMNKYIHKKEDELRKVEEEKRQKEKEEREKLLNERKFDKNVIKQKNVSNKKRKNLIEQDKKQRNETNEDNKEDND